MAESTAGMVDEPATLSMCFSVLATFSYCGDLQTPRAGSTRPFTVYVLKASQYCFPNSFFGTSHEKLVKTSGKGK